MKALLFDTETASIEGGVCELAIIEIDEQANILNSFESLIDPERPISSAAGGVHGIRDEDVAHKPTMAECMARDGNPFIDPDLLLIGYNVKFDIRMVKPHLPEKFRSMCLMRLAKNLWPEMENHQLQTLVYHFRLEKGPAHRAMGDVIATNNLLKLMLTQTGLSFAGLFKLSQQPLSLETRMAFGKHKGDKLKDLPLSYVRWLCSQADMDQDLKDALSVRLQ